MLRMTFALSIILFLSMVILGRDQGRVRLGLETTRSDPAVQNSAPAPVSRKAEIQSTDETTLITIAFAPKKPLIVPASIQTATPAAPAKPQAMLTPSPTSEPLRMSVSARSVNFRQGPGKEHPVIGKLARGDIVQVVNLAPEPDAWSEVRNAQDGQTGFVLTSLLSSPLP